MYILKCTIIMNHTIIINDSIISLQYTENTCLYLILNI